MYSIFGILFLLQSVACQLRFPTARQDENSCGEGQVCKKYSECDSAVRAWEISKKLPKTCYFEGKQQFVCCSDERDTAIRNPDDDSNTCLAGEVCTKYTECKSAIEAWEKSKELPKTCYFEGRQQFVCCAGPGNKIVEEPSKSQQST